MHIFISRRTGWVAVSAVAALFGGCRASEVDPRPETAEVYTVFLEEPWYPDTGPRLVVEQTDTVSSSRLLDAFGHQASPDIFSAEVSEALQDLFARGAKPHPLVPISSSDLKHQRISPDSVQRIRAKYQAMLPEDRTVPLPDSSVVLSLSPVGFSRDGSVAVVVGTQLCGWLCGETQVRVLRKHNDQWFSAEVLVRFVS